MRKYEYNGVQIYPTLEILHSLIPYLAGITESEFFLNQEKCIGAWKSAYEQLSVFFGDLHTLRTPTAPPLSYGHLVSLGVPLHQPENGEPNVEPCVSSIDEAIAFMEERRNIDFGAAPECRRYMEINAALQKEFPQCKIAPLASFGLEGVITTAELIRGQDFFCDLYDEPEKMHMYLSLVNESVIAFEKFRRRTNGWEEVHPVSANVADDFASLIPPTMWSEYVVPYWKHYFESLTTGNSRFVHCENLTPAHLPYLKDAGITRYQPSVSDALTIDNIRQNTDIPFDWLLYEYRITDMSNEEIQAWVDRTVEAGITVIRTQASRYAWTIGKEKNLLAFYKAFEKYRVE